MTASERDDAAKGLLAASSRDRAFDASRRRQLTADAALLLVTLIWGSTFVMVKNAVATFRCSASWRCALPSRRWCCCRSSCCGKETHGRMSWRARQPPPLRPSALCSSAPPLPCSSASRSSPVTAFQTAGLHLTTPAKAGFITGLSVVIVPLVAALILRQPPSRNAWLGVGLAMVGLALLTLQTGLRVEAGDLLVLCCAVAFAAHILLTGHFAPRYDPLRLTLGSIVIVAVLSGAAALIFDRPSGSRCAHAQVLFAAAFTGLFATSVAFGVQTVAQRFTTTTHTALIFAAEPVFAGAVQLPADRRSAGAAAGVRLPG